MMEDELSCFETVLANYEPNSVERTVLLNSFENLVNALPPNEMLSERVTRSIERFEELGRIDEFLFEEVGLEMIELLVRLQAMSNYDSWSLANLVSSCLSSREILVELNAIMSYMITDSENPVHPLEVLVSDMDGITDWLKIIILRFVPTIVNKMYRLESVVNDLNHVLQFIQTDLKQFHSFLQDPVNLDIFRCFINRKQQFLDKAYHQTLLFMLRYLSIYDSSEKYQDVEREVAVHVYEMFGPFLKIFNYWGSLEDSGDLNEGFSVLAKYAEDFDRFSIPLVFSGVSLIQIYLPIAASISAKKPHICLELIKSALKLNCQKMNKLSDPIRKVKNFRAVSLFSNFLDYLGSIPREMTSEVLTLFHNLLNIYSAKAKMKLLVCLVKHYPWDKAKALLLDMYTSCIVQQKGSCSYSFVEHIFRTFDVIEYPETYQAILKVVRIIAHEDKKYIFLFKNYFPTLSKDVSRAIDSNAEIQGLPILMWSLQEIDHLFSNILIKEL